MGNIQSLERAIAILKCFEHHNELGVTEIGALVGINTTTAYNLIHTLAVNGFLEQNENTRRYSLGVELLRIGSGYQRGLRDICMPWMQELSAATGETINLIQRMGHNATYIEKVESPHSMRICTEVGQRYPLYCSAAGKVLLAYAEEGEREELLTQLELRPLTSHTIVDKEQLRRELASIREQGYAEDREEMEYGLVCVAVPLINAALRPLAAISVSGPLPRMDEETRLAIRSNLKQAAAAIHPRLV